ncbi:molybdate ABC transporter substrate-binding protein [Nosocomiicoccus ampullae]|uniref:Molybdate transport system substrate-binding protein n=1 Tax=Nosocomiicoccus ampullae TaxID=489910 RepID=A0A9Q2CYJ8_9STAP|nr:molybdate ABC transporter substrate-binding protein [Nosocomiicoccus ampullae]MBB5175455.1 molybdate transport system substrate-binding protein [Nosocomiicoccus ampullae]QYA46866.1 molybdate ABC transporter substrate-binding protein [Nosocomiicoccus ampullae]
MKRLSLIALAFILLASCSTDNVTEDSSSVDTITISAAASLQDALNEAIEEYNKDNDINIDINYGGSGALREQILKGAPVDLFISASQDDFKQVEDEGLIIEKKDYLENKLVLICPDDSTTVNSIADLKNAEQIAIGEVDTVPAGKYAKEAFTSLNIFDELENKYIYVSDVRAVLTYVAQGEVDAGVVYETDAKTEEDNIDIVDEFGKDTHTPIIYPIGTLSDSKEVKAFYDFLNEDSTLEIFKKYGFTIE